ncbi:hypothetical protein LSTR_LSTR003293 [Laodelphax striatellus]|uniref:Uncharacterized protein n=1 Tax=Laodelphax striatellus TaxID=195883 RepID=A0A482XSD6_LAOST|nr:hypothetical protein LSTR_LSTR003293 [Laodelphax striatellus]
MENSKPFVFVSGRSKLIFNMVKQAENDSTIEDFSAQLQRAKKRNAEVGEGDEEDKDEEALTIKRKRLSVLTDHAYSL